MIKIKKGFRMSVKKIYTVDDYPLAAYTIKRTIETFSKHECEVLDFESPLVLLERFKKEFQDVDLVVTDYEMPNLRGNELIAKLRELKPDIKIIVISAWLDTSTGAERHLVEKEVKALKPDLILSKPIRHQWIEELDAILEREVSC